MSTTYYNVNDSKIKMAINIEQVTCNSTCIVINVGNCGDERAAINGGEERVLSATGHAVKEWFSVAAVKAAIAVEIAAR